MKKFTFLVLAILPFIGFGQNFAPNPTLNGAADWSDLSAGSTQAYDAAFTRTADGSGSYLINSSGGFNSGIKSSNISGLTAGEYLFSYYVYGTAGDKTKPIVRDNGTSNNIQGDVYTIQADNTWELAQSIFTVSGNGTVNIRAMVNSDDTAMDFHVDDINFEYIPPAGNTLTVNVEGAGDVALTLDQISYEDTDTETLTANAATHWSFDSWSGDITGSNNPETLLMDSDKTVTATFAIDPTFDYAFTFDTDGELEGWTLDPQLAVASHTGGLVTLAPTAEQWARINLYDFPIPTATYNKVTITLKNESTNDDLLGIIVINGEDTEVVTQPMTTSDSGFVSYVFDATQFTNWTDDIDSVRIRFSDEDGTSAGRSSGTGNIVLDDIVFSYDSSLSTSEVLLNEFAIYPNPVSNILNINSTNSIEKIEIFDVTGKKVIESATLTHGQLNVSSLNRGIYLVRLKDVDGNKTVKKLIKN